MNWCGLKTIWEAESRGTYWVPQGSILGPLIFTVFANDLPTVVKQCTVNLYADDTTLYCCCRDPQEVKCALEADLEAVANWIDAITWKWTLGRHSWCFSDLIPYSHNFCQPTFCKFTLTLNCVWLISFSSLSLVLSKLIILLTKLTHIEGEMWQPHN